MRNLIPPQNFLIGSQGGNEIMGALSLLYPYVRLYEVFIFDSKVYSNIITLLCI